MILRILCFLVIAGACGCQNPSEKTATTQSSSTSIHEPVDHSYEIAQWKFSYTSKANEYTNATYACISEMYARVYGTGALDSGPLCRRSCELLKEANDFVDQAPDYVMDARDYYIGWSKICPDPAKKRKGRKL